MVVAGPIRPLRAIAPAATNGYDLLFKVKNQKRRRGRRTQAAGSIVKFGLGKRHPTPHGQNAPHGSNSPARIGERPKVGYFELKRSVAASGGKLRMNGYAASGIEQDRRVTTMHSAHGVIDAAIRRPFDDRATALNLGYAKAQFLSHRRSAAFQQHGAQLLKPILLASEKIAHPTHHGS